MIIFQIREKSLQDTPRMVQMVTQKTVVDQNVIKVYYHKFFNNDVRTRVMSLSYKISHKESQSNVVIQKY